MFVGVNLVVLAGEFEILSFNWIDLVHAARFEVEFVA